MISLSEKFKFNKKFCNVIFLYWRKIISNSSSSKEVKEEYNVDRLET